MRMFPISAEREKTGSGRACCFVKTNDPNYAEYNHVAKSKYSNWIRVIILKEVFS